MIIQSSNVGMTGRRSYSSQMSVTQSMSVWGKGSMISAGFSAGTAQTQKKMDAHPETDSSENEQNVNGGYRGGADFAEDLMNRFKSGQRVQGLQRMSPTDRLRNFVKMREETLNYLLNLILGNEDAVKPEQTMIDLNSMRNQQYGGQYTSEYYYSEHETTNFTTQGVVKTSDGRQISFNVDLTLSRTFTEYASEKIDFGAPRMVDPLVINLDVPSADVRDQKFMFDLDADGHAEAISRLGAGSGFLALDKNADGRINDGSELFGARSGNGFADLANYDKDGNGWIDEADEIFDQLMIWTKDENGKDQLIGLGQAGVGAIYLGSKDTQFSLNNAHNETNAMVRKTGMFLYENGMTGTLQQLDFAAQA